MLYKKSDLMREINLTWSYYKTSDPLPEVSGVYIFTTEKIPFYVGTAKNLKNRITAHKRLFNSGKRTFFLKTKDIEKGKWFDKSLVYISGVSDSREMHKGKIFFDNTEIYFVSLKDEDRQLKNVESALQIYFRDKYGAHGLIPGTNSQWFGKTEVSCPDCVLRHDTEGLLKKPDWLNEFLARGAA